MARTTLRYRAGSASSYAVAACRIDRALRQRYLPHLSAFSPSAAVADAAAAYSLSPSAAITNTHARAQPFILHSLETDAAERA